MSRLIVLFWACLSVAGGFDAEMPLYVLADDDPGVLAGAVCLDGSPPAFYYQAATSPALNTTWALHFKGGAWCYDEASCVARAKHSNLGTSSTAKGVAATFGFSGSVVNPDPAHNPDFAEGHRLILWYCDGASFAGDVAAPLVVGGDTVFLRGRRVLHAILDRLARVTCAVFDMPIQQWVWGGRSHQRMSRRPPRHALM